MNAGPKFTNPKSQGNNARGINADMNTHSTMQSQTSGVTRTGIAGEMRDLPGSQAFSKLTMDYGAGKHEAYDSPLAQPAYSEHGKVRVF